MSTFVRQGKGIFLTRSWEAVDPAEPQVAQRYIRKPLLIDGFKFDLRIYILVLSCDPLRIYMYGPCTTRMSQVVVAGSRVGVGRAVDSRRCERWLLSGTMTA